LKDSSTKIRELIISSDADNGFSRLYGKQAIETQKNRYLKLLDQGKEVFSGTPPIFVSVPGRTELGGNHTDHQNGRVLAAAVDLDCVAAVVPDNDNKITLFSNILEKPVQLNLDNLAVSPGENGQPEALIRGVASSMKKQGLAVPGFSGYIHATCRPGSGLSSSAAFSVLTGAVFTTLAGRTIDPLQLAYSAVFAENVYFGKPCGLMDQISCALGSFLFIDFLYPGSPEITPLATDLFDNTPYRLVIIDSGGSHQELTSEYAAIPAEIEAVANLLGRDKARGASMESLLNNLSMIRHKTGDRAVLRFLHVMNEDRRVAAQFRALKEGRFNNFLHLVNESGTSSCQLLQNCSSSAQTSEQGILLALALTRQLCQGSIARVHGGGFAGTIQAYIPSRDFENYRRNMERFFGKSSVIPVLTGRPGVCFLTENGWNFPTPGDMP
jgi:galactokinase